MDELVSRQAVLVALKDALMAWSYMPKWRDEKIIEAMAELPSAQPHWIPVEKECPKEEDEYIVTIQCEHVDGWDDYVTGFAEWDGYRWDIVSFYHGQIKVVAWMELPSPYKGDRGKI